MNAKDIILARALNKGVKGMIIGWPAMLGAPGAGGADPAPGYQRVLGFSCDNNAMWQISGFKLKGSDTVRISFSVTAACNVFGCYQGTDATDNYDLYASITSGSKYFRYGGGTYLSYFSPANLDKRFDVVYTPTGSTGMPEDSTWTAKTFTSANDLLIGSTTTGGTSSKLKGNLYGDVIVDGRLHLVPCERVSDGVLGYYDKIGKTFYPPYTGFAGAVSLGYALPSGYTELSSLALDGSFWFKTGVVPASFDYEIECDAAFSNANTASPVAMWGFMGNQSSMPRWQMAGYSSQWLIAVNATTPGGTYDTSRHTFVAKVFEASGTAKYNASVDGTDIYQDTTIGSPSTFTANTWEIYIGGRNNNNVCGNKASGTFYSLKIRKGGDTVRYYVPVTRTSDSAVGLFDLISGKFIEKTTA